MFTLSEYEQTEPHQEMLHSQGHKTESNNNNNNNTGEAARQRKLQADCPLVYNEKSHFKKTTTFFFSTFANSNNV